MKLLFPFGSQLQKVEQQDKSPKEIFVLGVYASAVHAKWKGTGGKTKINALAVASEPYIFWRGEDAEEIINSIKVPPELGALHPADKRFNGPSGIALDKLFLEPLGYDRNDAWLCDLLPYARINPKQAKAIEREYNPLIDDYHLPKCTVPYYKESDLNNKERVNEIVHELEQSQAKKIVLLGDLPIKYFLSKFSSYRKLSDFGTTAKEYGREHSVTINNKTYSVIPLVHPRQAAALGKNSADWNNLHKEWYQQRILANAI